jgi:protein MAK16
MPNKWWEKIRLSSNYTKALQQVDERLIYWPKFFTHKCKQRLTRLTQVRVRAQRLAKEEERLGEKLVPRLAPKVRRREETRERKAESAAKIERAIERELVERLRSGAYGDRPLNVEEGIWRKVMKSLEKNEGVRDEDMDEEDEEEEDGVEYEYENEQEDGDVEYVSDMEESDGEEDDLEDFQDWLGGESGGEGTGDSSADDDDDDDEGEDDNASELKKKLDSLKRKRSDGPAASKGRKKPSKGGAKTNIEYEYEPQPRQMELA